MKVLTVVGARPQFIKAAAVTRVLRAHERVSEIMVHTGQHFDADMSEVFFEQLDIPVPTHHLGISGGTHGQMTGRMLEAIEQVLLVDHPDVLLTYGDTNSTLAGALAAAKLGVPVAHVEAGLRSFNRAMPEELNRVTTDHLSDLLFCPTSTAVRNLRQEGVSRGVYWVGDVMFDAALHAARRPRSGSSILEKLGLRDGSYAVATVHRAENTEHEGSLRRVVDYLADRAREQPIVIPLHPRTRIAAARAGVSLAGLLVCSPLGYFDMTRLVQGATCIYTDSGGLQKEAYFHRVPCVTLRSETEWVETLEAGWNRLWCDSTPQGPRRDIDEYGDGHAAERLVDILLSEVA